MKRARGTFWMRGALLLLAVVFGWLVYSSIGFGLDDLAAFQRPNWADFADGGKLEELRAQAERLEEQLRELNNQLSLLEQQRKFIRDATGSLQVTVDNLFKLRDRDQQLLQPEQFAGVLGTLDKILEIQQKFEATAEEYLAVTREKHKTEGELARIKKLIEKEEKKLRVEFAALVRKLQIRNAIFRLSLLLPLVLLVTMAWIRWRGSMYRMILASAAVALYVKTARVVHEYFPTRHFKYVVTAVALLLTAWAFAWLMRRLVKPKLDLLLKQYRQAYERFLCPVCEYPIRRGPRKYLYWTRRTVHKVALAARGEGAGDEQQPYVCPVCTTMLYETCEKCGNLRHSLLPACRVCGAEKEIAGDRY
ncbi:MAG: hypothetical protein GX803_00645 [Lentisphaerae bacterium]|nr:hypothetical protein [Lentisphaerota bacterium]